MEMGAESEKQNNDKEKCAVFEFDLIVSCKRYDMNRRIVPTQNKLLSGDQPLIIGHRGTPGNICLSIRLKVIRMP
jgi:hypothetical protein